MTISVADIQAVERQILSNSTVTKSIAQKFKDFVDYLVEHDQELSAEASHYANEVIRKQMDLWGLYFDKLPESIEKRQLTRIVASIAGKEETAEQHLKQLTYTPYLENLARFKPAQAKSLEQLEAVFLQLTESLLTILHEKTQLVASESRDFATLTLLYLAVDELLAGFHLARCSFSTQANAHIRTVFEILDKAQLFHGDPKWVEMWTTGDERNAWSALAPDAVRKELGKNPRDPFYIHLAHHGTHATFLGAQRLTHTAGKEGVSQKIALTAGGVKHEEEMQFTNMAAIVAAGSAVLISLHAMQKYLKPEEVTAIEEKTKTSVNEYLTAQRIHRENPEATYIHGLLDFWLRESK